MSIPGDQHDWKTCVQVDNPAGFSIEFAMVRIPTIVTAHSGGT
jgi:hypothetical protein